MTEMIKFLTKKFSHHSLTEVKPADQNNHGTCSSNQDDRLNDRRTLDQVKDDKIRLNSFSEEGDEPEDEEISTINLSLETIPKPLARQDNEQRTCPERLKYSPPTRNTRVTPPLKQFEMRLPDIEVERKYEFHTTIKPRKFIRANNQMLKQLDINRQSPLQRRSAFIDYAKETPCKQPDVPKASAFIRIPHIEGIKIHPRSNKSQKEKRNSKELSPLAEKITISKPVPCHEASYSDSEVAECRTVDIDANCFVTAIPKRSGSFTGKKSPSLLDLRSSPSLVKDRLSPAPLMQHGDKMSPVQMYMAKNHKSVPIIKDRRSPTPPPSYDYKCISSLEHPEQLSSAGYTETSRTASPMNIGSARTVSPINIGSARTSSPMNICSRSSPTNSLERIHRISPIHNRVQAVAAPRDISEAGMLRDIDIASHKEKALKSLDRINQLHEKKKELMSAASDKREILLASPTSERKKFSVERILRGKSTEKAEVEMVESFDHDRNIFHKNRINAAYNNDLKRKYSVIPVDDEVRSICAATSKSNFQAAFILTTNPAQSGVNHRTLDISVVRPNKRVCCTDGYSPPIPRRPSINVEKMAQTILIRRPLVRKAGQPSRVWSTKEQVIPKPVTPSQFRPLNSQLTTIPVSSSGT